MVGCGGEDPDNISHLLHIIIPFVSRHPGSTLIGKKRECKHFSNTIAIENEV